MSQSTRKVKMRQSLLFNILLHPLVKSLCIKYSKTRICDVCCTVASVGEYSWLSECGTVGSLCLSGPGSVWSGYNTYAQCCSAGSVSAVESRPLPSGLC